MSKFDFKSYHLRSMNAINEEEKSKINEELKFFYESLTQSNKDIFNKELESFLVNEYAKIKSVMDASQASNVN